MPSPVGHTLASLLVRACGEPKGWPRRTPAPLDWWQTPLAAAIFGSLPDIDLAFSWLLVGNPAALHQYFTHNLAFALVAGLAVSFFVTPRDRLRAGLWAFALVSLHIVLDAGVGPVIGEPGTLGVRALWPLSEHRFGFPVAFIPTLEFGHPSQILSLHNASSLLHEMVLFGVPLGLTLWLRR